MGGEERASVLTFAATTTVLPNLQISSKVCSDTSGVLDPNRSVEHELEIGAVERAVAGRVMRFRVGSRAFSRRDGVALRLLASHA